MNLRASQSQQRLSAINVGSPLEIGASIVDSRFLIQDPVTVVGSSSIEYGKASSTKTQREYYSKYLQVQVPPRIPGFSLKRIPVTGSTVENKRRMSQRFQRVILIILRQSM